MKDIWDRTQTYFHREDIPQLLMMCCVPNHPQAPLFVQGTGVGKSVVAQTVGIFDCGVTLIIKETLELVIDQQSKVTSTSNAYGPVLVYKLDSMKKENLITKLETKLLALKKRK